MTTHKFLTTSCLLLSSLYLTACGTPAKSTLGPSTSDKIEHAIANIEANRNPSLTAAPSASLNRLEQRYKANPMDPSAAYDYAQALRRDQYLNRASMVITPFAEDQDSPVYIKNEFIAIQLEMGNYGRAEEYAQLAILQDPENGKTYHYLGIALEAQGLHKEAERAFRKGLDHWDGDPAPIMNNLALNLATQGYVDEALEILEKAMKISQNRGEIQRNYRIISALQKTNKPRRNPAVAPVVPTQKPSEDSES